MNEKVLNTITKSFSSDFVGNESNLKLLVYYQKDEEQLNDNFIELNNVSTDEVELLEEYKRKNGVFGMEGELIINNDIDVLWSIDIDGSLNVSDFDVDKYEINEMGELILNL